MKYLYIETLMIYSCVTWFEDMSIVPPLKRSVHGLI